MMKSFELPLWSGDSGAGGTVADRPNATPKRPSLEDGAALLRAAKTFRTARHQCAGMFPRNLFRDSAWDMMLELFITDQENGSICVKQLMAASGESATGAVRRIDGLEEAGLVSRRVDPADHRRVKVVLTEKGFAAMVAMLRHICDMGDIKPLAPGAAPVSFSPRGLR